MRDRYQGMAGIVRRSPVPVLLGWWLGLFVLWLLLVEPPAPAEVVAAALAAALVAAAVAVVARQGMAPAAPSWRWLVLLARRVPPRALADCAVVFAALWRRLVLRERMEGEFRVIRFDPGGDDPRSAARRALLVAAISLPPNSFVVRVNAEVGWLLIHQLVPSAQPHGGAGVEWPL